MTGEESRKLKSGDRVSWATWKTKARSEGRRGAGSQLIGTTVIQLLSVTTTWHRFIVRSTERGAQVSARSLLLIFACRSKGQAAPFWPYVFILT
jgi:hypothetical protein